MKKKDATRNWERENDIGEKKQRGKGKKMDKQARLE